MAKVAEVMGKIRHKERELRMMKARLAASSAEEAECAELNDDDDDDDVEWNKTNKGVDAD